MPRGDVRLRKRFLRHSRRTQEVVLSDDGPACDVLPASSTTCNDDAAPNVQTIDLQSLEYLESSPRTDLEGGETPASFCAPFSARVRTEAPAAEDLPPADATLPNGDEAGQEDEDALPQTTESIPIPTLASASPRNQGFELETAPVEARP